MLVHEASKERKTKPHAQLFKRITEEITKQSNKISGKLIGDITKQMGEIKK